MKKQTYVIAISGPSGAGKTTLANNLVQLFGDAFMLGVDNYDYEFPNSAEWIARGADPDEFQTPQFLDDVRSLKEGRQILHPETKAELNPPAYLILEEPFGKARKGFKDLIDFHAEVDTPLELALSRRILRILAKKSEDEKIPFVTQHLEWYLSRGRRFYLAVQENARKDKDISIDGTLPPEEIAKKIFEAVKEKRKP